VYQWMVKVLSTPQRRTKDPTTTESYTKTMRQTRLMPSPVASAVKRENGRLNEAVCFCRKFFL
jgi:hypothetical protein